MNENTQQIPKREDIAGSISIDTVNSSELQITREQVPWLDSQDPITISTVEVESEIGQYRLGSVIGANDKIQSIADKDMRGKEPLDDKLNRAMHIGIQHILMGNPGALKRVQNAPEGVAIYYDQTKAGARVFFTDLGTDKDGVRVFLKTGVCASKNNEAKIIGAISGKGKNEKVKK